jgi:hypothetical protein
MGLFPQWDARFVRVSKNQSLTINNIFNGKRIHNQAQQRDPAKDAGRFAQFSKSMADGRTY